jgi:hypothetical protein
MIWVYALTILVPWNMQFPNTDLDTSWVMVMHWAHLHHVDFGHQLIFPYGPWSFLWSGYSPADYAAQIECWVLLTAALLLGASDLGRRSAGRWAGLGFAFVIISLAGLPLQDFADVRMFLLGCLLLVLQLHLDPRPISASRILLLIAMALATQVKFTMAILAFGVILLTVIEDLRRRRPPVAMGVFLGAFLSFWLIAHQPLSGLPPYLAHSWELSVHYQDAEAMQSPRDVQDLLCFLGCSVGIIFVLAMGAIRGKQLQWQGWIQLAGLFLPLFLAFKIEFVRHEDVHDLLGYGLLLGIVLIWGAAIWTALPGTWARAGLALVVAGTLFAAAVSFYQRTGPTSADNLSDADADLYARARAAFQLLAGNSTADTDYFNLINRMQHTVSLPAIHGTVDDYSWEQWLILSNNLDYQARPVIHSYLACTANLAGLNADFLRGPRAPDSILFNVQCIDRHWPSTDDAPSWPLILTRYDLRDTKGGVLLFERSQAPRNYSISSISTARFSFNQWQIVPHCADPIWVKIDVPIRLAGQILGVVYRRPQLILGARLNDGQLVYGVIPPEIAQSGFLLSPVIFDRRAFALLQSDRWSELLQPLTVREIAIMPEAASGQSICYSSLVTAEYSRLAFQHRDISLVLGAMR